MVPDLAASGLWSTPEDLLIIAAEFIKALNGSSEYALISLVDGESEIGWLDLSQQSYEDMLVTRTYFAG